MRTKEVAAAVEEWAVSIVPGLHAEPTQPEQLAQSLPLAICEVTEKRRANGQSTAGVLGYQQTGARAWSAQLMLLVAPTDPWTASQLLYDMVDDLEAAIVRDPTLGGRVPVSDSSFSASFSPPEVEHQDGTVARLATMRLTIGEQVGGP